MAKDSGWDKPPPQKGAVPIKKEDEPPVPPSVERKVEKGLKKEIEEEEEKRGKKIK